MTAPQLTGSRLCVIHGNSLAEGADPIEGERIAVDAGGVLPVEATDGGEIVGVARHGFDRSISAHVVDHKANIRAVCELGCDRVLALGSAGSLHPEIEVGTLLCPDDFYAPEIAPSFYRDARGHSVPGFGEEWRRALVRVWGSHAETGLADGGVYAQTLGPRFETPAEVRALAKVADIVGMTLAAEAVLAREAGLVYAAVCSIDNYANGVLDRPLTLEEYRRGRDRTAGVISRGLREVLPALAGERPG